MTKPDLILLHAPSVYDFRELSIMHGPVSDVVPSSPVFEMYPFGFTTIAEYLQRFGYNVRIINLAFKMLKDPSFDVEKFIQSLNTVAFGIDLHWLPHAHGSLEIAKILKKHHPETPVIFGGLSSSYFHKQLIEYPYVDYVVRGDSTEKPLLELIKCIKSKGDFKNVPNLTWKNSGIEENPLSFVPEDINYISMDYKHIFKAVIKYRDFFGYVPFENWFNYPITVAMTCRGCTQNCIICGASAKTMRKCFNRKKTAFRDPELLASDISKIRGTLKGPIFVPGDLRQHSEDYANTFLNAVKKYKIKNSVCFEIFKPADEEFFHKVSEAVPNYSFEASIDSHEGKIRKATGRFYSDLEIEETLKAAMKNNCQRFDLFFLTGLPHQTKDSVLDTVDYCRNLYQKLNGDKRLLVLVSPLAPFLDPGSIAFENPEKHGYKLFHKTLEEHRKALLAPSWKYTLNYETKWMTRDEIVESTYKSAIGLNKLKNQLGIINPSTASRIESRTLKALETVNKIDSIIEDCADVEERNKKLHTIKDQIKAFNTSTICEKEELAWPTKFFNFKVKGILKALVNKN